MWLTGMDVERNPINQCDSVQHNTRHYHRSNIFAEQGRFSFRHRHRFRNNRMSTFNTLRTSDADLRFYITTVQDG